ncbi:type II toxin-antitoxin system RelE/ParE family toxin [Ottowia sp.]|uniref:type II toxin-antitoxin system RelE/ParE family toxin n=1 Tax=Ottowia sp. TaxID=1898956 RepID=UPI0039E51FAD
MQALFRPEARLDALEAKAWYEAQSPGLGLEFSRALDAAVASALRMPLAFREIDGRCRRVFMRRFPYSVIYRAEPDGIVVFAVFHHRRDPGIWSSRVDG